MDNTTVSSNKLQYKSSKEKFHQVLFQQRKLMLPVKIVKFYVVNVKTALIYSKIICLLHPCTNQYTSTQSPAPQNL